jgi:ribosomal protein S18 acetylase RimI-like enzyme
MAVHLRPAEPVDLAAVADLVVASYVGEGYIASDSPYITELRAVAARWREAEVLVAVAPGGALAGTVTFCRPGTPWAEISQPGEAEFRMLAVASTHRGAGVGRSLVQECLTRAAGIGARQVVISTVSRMQAAQRMYESMGFVRLPSRDWSPRPGVNLLVYARPL